MPAKTVKVYVTAPSGRYLPTYGQRDYGQFFELPEDVAQALLERPGFSRNDPTVKAAPKPAVSARPNPTEDKTEMTKDDTSD